jgi:hypothetical protein
VTMKDKLKLHLVMLGCKPEGRFTEQHDIFFGIGKSLKELIPQMKAFWPEAKGKIHIDAWREVTIVDNFSIEIIAKKATENSVSDNLFFINLGGYKENEFEEYHYKLPKTWVLLPKMPRQQLSTNTVVSKEPLRTLMTNTALMWMISTRSLIYCRNITKNIIP